MLASFGIFENLEMIGGMFYIYAAARLINYWRLHYEDANENTTFEAILGIIYIILCVVSFPVSLIMYGINYFYNGRTEQLHTKEIIKKSNEDYAFIKETKIKPLEQKIIDLELEAARLQEFASEEMRKGYALGRSVSSDESYTTGYTNGFTDGFEECLTYTFYSEEEKESLRAKAREFLHLEEN